jgi:hypothetical protein
MRQPTSPAGKYDIVESLGPDGPAFRLRFDVMEHADCGEQSRLFDQYSRAVTSYSLRLEAVRRAPHKQSANDWLEIERARDESEAAWKALEEHIARHRCLGLPNTAGMVASSEILGQAAAAALVTLRKITEVLNQRGFTTRRGTAWRFQYVAQVDRSTRLCSSMGATP